MQVLDRFRRACLLLALLASSCSADAPSPRGRVVAWEPPPGSVREGGLSDLALDPSEPDGRTFFAVSDRGPNEARGGIARFASPAYHQKILRFRLQVDGSLVLLGRDSVRSSQGAWTTGLPSPFFPSSERAVARGEGGRGIPLGTDSAGFDFEGIAGDGDDGFWLSEEYGPRILHARRDAAGLRIDRALAPGAGLPEVFARRAVNKGLEALCRTPRGLLVAAFQGALDNAAAGAGSGIAERSLARRILVIDPADGSMRENLELVPDDPDGKTSRRTKTGACTALDDHRILLLEHRKRKKAPAQVDIVLLDLANASDVHQSRDSAGLGRLVGGRTLEEIALDPEGLAAAGIRPAARTVLLPDVTSGLSGELAKPEGLVVLRDSTFVIAFDNDFGIEGGGIASRFVVGRLPSVSGSR